MRLIIFLGVILFFFFGLEGNSSSLWAKKGKTPPTARLIQIENQVLPDSSRVILKTNRVVYPSDFIMNNPPRLVLDLKPCVLGSQKTFTLKDPSIAGTRLAQFNSKTVRIVFDFSHPPVYKISQQKGKLYQIFIDFPKIKPQPIQPLSQKTEDILLPKTNIEEFKKEIASQELRQKEEKAHSQKPLATFDFYMSNLHNVLRLIGEIGGVNIVIGDEVKDKKVTLSLKEVPWDEAMNSILEGSNLRKLKRGEKTFLITTSENFKKILDDENKNKLDAIKMRAGRVKGRRTAPESRKNSLGNSSISN